MNISNRHNLKSLVLLAIVGAISTFPDMSRASPAESISGERLLEYIEVLASDDFEGRLPGTPGGKKTENYLADLWRSFGVRPANNGSFFQEVRLAGVRQVSGSNAVFVAEGKELELENRKDLVFSGSRVAEVARLDDSELVFVGYGIVAPEYGWNDYAGVDVKGKTVVALWGDPGIHTVDKDPDLFKGKAATIHAMSSYKAEQAARHGADGILLVHDEVLAGWPWQVAIQGLPGIKYKLAEPRESTPAPKIGGLVSRNAADKIFAFAGLNFAELATSARTSAFAPVPLGLTVNMSVANELSEVSSNNVVGIVPGRKRPNEYIIYTAHWDHVGVKPEMEGDNIFNGAMDNATGTAGISEIARVIASMDDGPDRSVVFIATTAEEQGLLGAFYYADNPLYPLDKTAGVFNMDAHYPYGEFDGMVVVGKGNSELEDYIEKAATAIGRETFANPAPEQGAFYRSDHYPFAKAGVPSIYAVGAPVPREGTEPTEQERIMAEYVSTKYHKPGDEVDPETWDLRGVVQDVQVYLMAGLSLASDPRWPNWNYDNEFRAKRDRSMRTQQR